MQTSSFLQWLSQCITDGCQRQVGQSDFEMTVYLGFCISNLGRVLTYLPTIQKLRSPGCTGDGQSVWTWFTWIMANGMFALHLYVVSGYQVNDLVWLNLANLVMCCVCLRYVVKTQNRAGTLCWVPFRKPHAGQPIKAAGSDGVLQYLAQPTGSIPPAARS